MDNAIYTIFRLEFPKLDVKIINEDEMKSQTEKIKWRMFCERFKDVVEDYNFGTLLRSDCSQNYTQENSILVPRMQFLAIELARNKEGWNDIIRSKFKQQNKETSIS